MNSHVTLNTVRAFSNRLSDGVSRCGGREWLKARQRRRRRRSSSKGSSRRLGPARETIRTPATSSVVAFKATSFPSWSLVQRGSGVDKDFLKEVFDHKCCPQCFHRPLISSVTTPTYIHYRPHLTYIPLHSHSTYCPHLTCTCRLTTAPPVMPCPSFSRHTSYTSRFLYHLLPPPRLLPQIRRSLLIVPASDISHPFAHLLHSRNWPRQTNFFNFCSSQTNSPKERSDSRHSPPQLHSHRKYRCRLAVTETAWRCRCFQFECTSW